MMNALRLSEGFNQTLFEQRSGLNWTIVADTIRILQARGLIQEQAGQFKATQRGFVMLDSLLGEFLAE